MIVDNNGAMHDARGQYAGAGNPAASFDLHPAHPEAVTDVTSLDGPAGAHPPVEDVSRAERYKAQVVAAGFDKAALRAVTADLSDADFEDVWTHGTANTYPVRALAAAEHTLRHGVVDRATLESVGLNVHDHRTDRFGDLVPGLADADLEARLEDQGWALADDLADLRTRPVARRSLVDQSAARHEDAARALADAQAALDDEPTVAQINALDDARGKVEASEYVLGLLASGAPAQVDPWEPGHLPVDATRRLYATIHAGHHASETPALTPEDRLGAVRHLRARSGAMWQEAAALSHADPEDRRVVFTHALAAGLADAADWLSAQQ